MKNVKKLFEENGERTFRYKMEKGTVYFKSTDKIFSGKTILTIINFVNSIHKTYKNIKMPIVFSFGNIELADKLSYVIFECICYSLMNDYGHRVYIYWNPKRNILTDGVFSSPLKLLNTGKTKSADKFVKKFYQDIYHNHFRRVIDGDIKEETNYLGKLLQELDSFLKYFSITEEYRDQISEVISELVGNACEHGNTECLLDIDVADEYFRSNTDALHDEEFYGINISIINFSDILLGDGIRNKIESNSFPTERYKELENAYGFHKRYFTEDYLLVDFCNIATLQDKISGRNREDTAGGTGLTKLVKSLQEKSDMASCYVASGNRCVIFYKEFLEYDENEWLGFNESKDFFNNIPNDKVIAKNSIFLPGTAYNLNFVMKREEE